MRVSGFTILRQTLRLGYPFVESIRSLLPLVDELVVAVGDGDDGTWEAVQALGDPKIAAFHSPWDLSERVGGHTLSAQTNLALARCRGEWAIYLQADEVFHEDDLERLHTTMERHRHRRTEGLVFQYLHFYGSYDMVADDWRRWYPRAVRAVKTGIGVESVGDACGFQLRRGRYTRGLINAVSGARVFHYGWCGQPDLIGEKHRNLQRFYHDERWIEERRQPDAEVDVFARHAGRLRRFSGTHPQVMGERLAARSWPFDPQLHRQRARWLQSLEIVSSRLLTKSGGDPRPIVPLPLSNARWRARDFWILLAERVHRRTAAG